MRVLPTDRAPPKDASGTPLPDSKAEQPPVIRRAELVAFALVALLVISVVAVLYAAKAFFLPVVSAFVVGTMLSPAAGFLEQRRIPRAVSAVLIVSAVGAGVAFMVGTDLLARWWNGAPGFPNWDRSSRTNCTCSTGRWRSGMNFRPWSACPTPARAPDSSCRNSIGFEPTVGFLSPTFTEFLLFIATLILFIASWRDLRRALIMTFADHAARLRMLRILNEIEGHLGGYLLTVTMINMGVGIATGIICAVTGMPNPAGLGALAATLNFFPIIGPVAMFVILVARRRDHRRPRWAWD